MKNKTITTDKATLLLVEFPEGSEIESELFVNNYGRYIRWWNKGKDYLVDLPDEDGNWQLIGRIPDITEEQAGRIVPNDYHKHIRADARWYWALLFDFLKDNEVYFENTLWNEPKITSGEYDDNGFGDIDKHQFKRDLKSWQEAQSKVWDKERCYLFIKVD